MPDLYPPRFVIGTGRCGSTLLSRMLSENPEILSLFEWFSGIDAFFRFQPGAVAGSELADRLRQDHPVLTEVLKRGYEVPEVVYPFGQPGARYGAPGEKLPWSQGITLARISDDPDALFDAMIEAVEALPEQPLMDHYRAIFDWLTARLGRGAWVERSAGSIEFLAALSAGFPEARYVHLHRDGRETALSMREYPAIRVGVVLMYGLAGELEYSYEGLTQMARSGGEKIDRVLETRPPIELYGRYWAQQIEAGHAALSGIDPERVLDLRFEDMAREPLPALCRIRDFFELGGDDEWVERGAALVRGLPPLRYPALSPDERARLDEACAPAMELLGREMS